MGQYSQAATRSLPRSRVLRHFEYGCATHGTVHIFPLCTFSLFCPHNIKGARKLCMLLSWHAQCSVQAVPTLACLPQYASLSTCAPDELSGTRPLTLPHRAPACECLTPQLVPAALRMSAAVACLQAQHHPKAIHNAPQHGLAQLHCCVRNKTPPAYHQFHQKTSVSHKKRAPVLNLCHHLQGARIQQPHASNSACRSKSLYSSTLSSKAALTGCMHMHTCTHTAWQAHFQRSNTLKRKHWCDCVSLCRAPACKSLTPQTVPVAPRTSAPTPPAQRQARQDAFAPAWQACSNKLSRHEQASLWAGVQGDFLMFIIVITIFPHHHPQAAAGWSMSGPMGVIVAVLGK